MADKQYPIRIDLKPNQPSRQRQAVFDNPVGQAIAPATMLALKAMFGGSHEPPKTQKAAGAPTSQPPLTTKPDGRSLYNNLQEALTRGMIARGNVTLNDLLGLAKTVPQAPDPLTPKEVAQTEFLRGISQIYDPQIAQAQALKDPELELNLFEKKRAELVKLFEPDLLSMMNFDEGN